ncbi:Vacuolar protein sorting-associated protein 37A [Porphyridium purpureum]|uniref:Vacuolar protein sorting-associated protein 37A n=1 Tax=Porphyridium purpureum TaxID=35688 RepID=A0A5J4YSY9_PORPP|nr:Vacuolar protein sorting-associated protein 37A [Porphyridium purpureum]|eukprot:POR5969..scf227_4
MWAVPQTSWDNPYGSGHANGNAAAAPGGLQHVHTSGPVNLWNSQHNLFDANASGSFGSFGSVATLQRPAPGEGGRKHELPPVPQDFPELAQKSVQELEALLRNQGALESMLNRHAYVSELARAVETTKETVATKRKELEDLKESKSNAEWTDRLHAADKDHASLLQDVEALRQKHNDIVRQNAPDALEHRLEMHMEDADRESMRLHEQGMGREMPFDEFLRKYVEQRKLYHAREKKLASLRQMRRNASAGGNNHMPRQNTAGTR